MLQCRTIVPTLCLLSLVASLLPAAPKDPPREIPKPPRERQLRVLLLTGSHPFEREPFFKVFEGHPDFTAREVQQPEALKWFAPEKADEYDAMVWYDFDQKISETDKRNLVDLLNKGKPLVILHHALANYQDWPEALKIIGGRYHMKDTPQRKGSTFKHDVRMKIKIADPTHPITRFMKDFEILDEAYGGLEVRPEVKPLLTTDHPENHKVLAWTHTYGKSRVAYIQLGHDHHAYENPNYRRLVAQAIRWTAGLLPEASDDGFTPLFNGKDLEGWTVVGDPAGFVVKDGILHSDSGKNGQWLRTNRTFENFILKVEYKVAPNGNSGVFIRSARDGYPWETGSEIQIANEERDAIHCTGTLYGNVAVDPRPDESADVWHEFIIECRGPYIRVWVDGVPVIDVDQRKVAGLKDKPLAGYIGLQDSHSIAGWVQYRKVMVKELPAGEK